MWIRGGVFLAHILSFRIVTSLGYLALDLFSALLPPPLPPPLEMEPGWPPDLTCVNHIVSGPEALVTPGKCTKKQRTGE